MTACACAYGVTFMVCGTLAFYYNGWHMYVRDAFALIYFCLSIQGWIFAI